MNFSNKKWQDLENKNMTNEEISDMKDDEKSLITRKTINKLCPPRIKELSNKPRITPDTNKELSYCNSKEGNDEKQISDLIYMLHKINENPELQNKKINEDTNLNPDDVVNDILSRLYYLNKHYKLSTQLKSEIQLITNTIKNSEHRHIIKKQISIMENPLPTKKQPEKKPMLIEFPTKDIYDNNSHSKKKVTL